MVAGKGEFGMRVGTVVCHRDDVWEGDKFVAEVNGKPIMIVNIDGEIKAYQGWCPHQAQSLENAAVDGCQLTCMAHVWEFDLKSGKGINPEHAKLKAFPVEEDDEGNIIVKV